MNVSTAALLLTRVLSAYILENRLKSITARHVFVLLGHFTDLRNIAVVSFCRENSNDTQGRKKLAELRHIARLCAAGTLVKVVKRRLERFVVLVLEDIDGSFECFLVFHLDMREFMNFGGIQLPRRPTREIVGGISSFVHLAGRSTRSISKVKIDSDSLSKARTSFWGLGLASISLNMMTALNLGHRLPSSEQLSYENSSLEQNAAWHSSTFLAQVMDISTRCVWYRLADQEYLSYRTTVASAHIPLTCTVDKFKDALKRKHCYVLENTGVGSLNIFSSTIDANSDAKPLSSDDLIAKYGDSKANELVITAQYLTHQLEQKEFPMVTSIQGDSMAPLFDCDYYFFSEYQTQENEPGNRIVKTPRLHDFWAYACLRELSCKLPLEMAKS
ncbi:hypothetical protein AeMF1_006716 [Aphanomyces euteiches]|nr:hypothetical protein AeMF1_006716 [Aphanomyces euteiches]KAH9182982.1 hypothetical protein AeNC1_015042 [Aphanomyces euteiches]